MVVVETPEVVQDVEVIESAEESTPETEEK
jgi:hypothetical protein